MTANNYYLNKTNLIKESLSAVGYVVIKTDGIKITMQKGESTAYFCVPCNIYKINNQRVLFKQLSDLWQNI